MSRAAPNRPARSRDVQMFGRYRLLGRLAAGGMAEVWAAQLLAPGGFCKPMVIKRVLPELSTSPAFLRMLMSEARVAARLSHGNICSVFELGEVDGEYYIAMEYLRGAPLTRLLKAGGALPVAEAVAVIAQACEGLHYAHEQRDASGNLLGLVHRDVSPHNLFVTVDGNLKLLDFGIAKVDDGSGDRTEAGKVKGKLPYMSPEQLMAEPLDRRSDVWSLGVVLWELLSGRRLFGGVGPADTVDAIRSARVPALSTVGVDAPAIDEVLARAMCRNREWRHPTAAELRKALLQALSPAPPAGADELSQRVWTRCGDDVYEADRLFEDEPVAADPGVVDRLPLRAEATQPAIEIEAMSEASSAAIDAVIGPLTSPTVPTVHLPGALERQEARAAVPAADTSPVAITPPEDLSDAAVALGGALRPRRRGRLAVLLVLVAAAAALAWVRFGRNLDEEPSAQPAPVVAAPAPLPPAPPAPVAQPPAATAAADVPAPEVAAPPAPPQLEPPAEEMVPAPTAAADRSAASGDDREPAPPRADPPKTPRRGGTSRKSDTSRPADKPARDDAARPPADKPGRLFVDARPWATIYVDGAKLGVTPIVGASLPAGDHQLKAVAEDGRTRTMRVHVGAGADVRRRVTW